jgi:hypothetical protein
MKDFTMKIIGCLAKGEKIDETIQELFRFELERAVNELVKIELAGFLNYERYERSGLSSENSWDGSDERKLNTIHGELNLIFPWDRPTRKSPKSSNRSTRKKYSRGTISNITETIIANVEPWIFRRTLSHRSDFGEPPIRG